MRRRKGGREEGRKGGREEGRKERIQPFRTTQKRSGCDIDSMLVHRCVLILVPLLNCKQKKLERGVEGWRGGGVEGWRRGEEEERREEESTMLHTCKCSCVGSISSSHLSKASRAPTRRKNSEQLNDKISGKRG